MYSRQKLFWHYAKELVFSIFSSALVGLFVR